MPIRHSTHPRVLAHNGLLTEKGGHEGRLKESLARWLPLLVGWPAEVGGYRLPFSVPEPQIFADQHGFSVVYLARSQHTFLSFHDQRPMAPAAERGGGCRGGESRRGESCR